MPSTVPADLLTSLLRDVSRSFYLTLRVLPAAVRPQIGLAYLLARATDTIADSELVPVPDRLGALARLRGRILGREPGPVDFARLAAAQAAPGGGAPATSALPPAGAEARLLQRINEALTVLDACESADRDRIRAVLDTITGGQELDLRRFGGDPQGGIRALATADELDDYTYRVAGCVGEFWTRMCRARLFPGVPLDEAQLLADGIRFGCGLQLVNILRDLPRDLRSGRCYLPTTELAAAGLQPADLLDPANEARLRPVYDRWLGRATAHLEAGWRYTLALPADQRRVRLACAWPVLLGVRTLARLRTGAVLDPSQRLKVGRPEVRAILVGSLLRLPFRGAWDAQFSRANRA